MAKKVFDHEQKKWYTSKTMWVSGLQIVGGVLLVLSDELATGGALTALGVLHAILRVITKSKLV